MSEQALQDEEEFQFLMMTHGFFLAVQNSYLLVEEGTIDLELRNSLFNAIGGINQLPGLERYWRQRKNYWHADFAEWVELVLSSAREEEVTMDLYDLENDQPSGANPE